MNHMPAKAIIRAMKPILYGQPILVEGGFPTAEQRTVRIEGQGFHNVSLVVIPMYLMGVPVAVCEHLFLGWSKRTEEQPTPWFSFFVLVNLLNDCA
jgi:hypothetical protein